MNSEIGKKINVFLSQETRTSEFIRSPIFLCRDDGLLVFFNATQIDERNASSIGALVGGAWQAAASLSEFIPHNKDDLGFRLSFDTSSRGLYVLPVLIEDREYYLGIIFNDEINPALVKAKLRKLLLRFNHSIKTEGRKKPEPHRPLFDNITDSEMDALFGE